MATFAKPSEYSGASFFKPGDYMTALALLIEPKSIEKNVPNEYKGRVTTRDEVIADITVFENQAALDAGKPSSELKSTKVVHGMLASTLEKIMGGAMVATVTKTATRNGEGYVFRDVDSKTESVVGDYYDNREKAVADALESAPDFE